MEWMQVLTIIVTHLTLFLWARREASEDRKENGSDRREITKVINEDRKEITKLIHEIHQEMKDFHGRLYAIEERNKGK